MKHQPRARTEREREREREREVVGEGSERGDQTGATRSTCGPRGTPQRCAVWGGDSKDGREYAVAIGMYTVMRWSVSLDNLSWCRRTLDEPGTVD